MTTQKGAVKWFNQTKGYGFISPSDGGKDIFVHINAVHRSGMNGLSEGQTLEFEIEGERDKKSAINLKAL